MAEEGARPRLGRGLAALIPSSTESADKTGKTGRLGDGGADVILGGIPGAPTVVPQAERPKQPIGMGARYQEIPVGEIFPNPKQPRQVFDAEDMAELKRIVNGQAACLAKIEKPAALADLEAILDYCDGVMVARGDLGVELDPEDVPVAQKQIVRAARNRGVPVIVATQMLESMTSAPAPTRAEATDV